MIASTQTNHPIAGGRSAGRVADPLAYSTAKLKAAGLRITQPRLSILQALAKQPQPISTEALHQLLGSEGCDLVTVYRCLSAFEDIGLVRRSFLHSGTALYEIDLGQPIRYRVVCKATNQVQELDAETSAELGHSLRQIEEKLRARGFEDIGHIVEFFGKAPQGGRLGQAASSASASR